MYLEDEDQEQIDFMDQFPGGPREDLIARYFYHHIKSNGSVFLQKKESNNNISKNSIKDHSRSRGSIQISPTKSARIWSLLMWLFLRPILASVTWVYMELSTWAHASH